MIFKLFGSKSKTLKIRYFLKTDVAAKEYTFGDKVEKFYSLYIEITHRRKVIRIRSKFQEFYRQEYSSENIPIEKVFEDDNYYYSNLGIALSYYNDILINTINEPIRPKIIGQNSIPNLIFYERENLINLFDSLINLEDEELKFSNFSNAYEYSIVFVYDLFFDYLKNHASSIFNRKLPDFPSLMLNCNIMSNDYFLSLSKILAITKPEFIISNDESQLTFGEIAQLNNIIRNYFENSNLDLSEITISFWVNKKINHDFKEKTILAISNFEGFSSKDKIVLFFNSMAKFIENKIFTTHNELIKKFS